MLEKYYQSAIADLIKDIHSERRLKQIYTIVRKMKQRELSERLQQDEILERELASSCMVSMLLSEKDEETQRKIENTKIKIFCEEEPKGMLHIIELADILKKYR